MIKFSHFILCLSLMEPEPLFGLCLKLKLKYSYQALKKKLCSANLKDFLNGLLPSSCWSSLPSPHPKSVFLQNSVAFSSHLVEKESEGSSGEGRDFSTTRHLNFLLLKKKKNLCFVIPNLRLLKSPLLGIQF